MYLLGNAWELHIWFLFSVNDLNYYFSFLIFGCSIEIITFFRYEMAEDCADDDDAKAGISDLRKSALEELKMHNSIVEVSLEASCPIDF